MDSAEQKSSKPSSRVCTPRSRRNSSSPPIFCWAKFAARSRLASPALKTFRLFGIGRKPAPCQRIKKMIKHSALLVLCTAITVSFPLGCGEASKEEIRRNMEEARVTSPNGLLDAVMIREDGGGAPGGWEWYAYIVAKGSAVDARRSHEIFHAGTLTGEKLVWSQPHLL